MATSDILGLFVSPEQYQAQQLAQQQANEQQRAFNFAQLSPRDQAVYGTFLGAQQLGRGFSGLLGVQDPQLQRIRQRDQLMQSINPADPASLMAGIKAATNAGDQELALTLTDFMNKQGSEMALAQQRKAAADKERTQALPAGIQEAARVAEIERTLSKLDKVKDATEIKALTEEKARLQKSAKAAGTTDDEKKAAAYANSISADPESKEWKDAFGKAFERLIFGKEAAKEYSPEAKKLVDAGYIPGSPSFISKMDELISGGGNKQIDKLVIADAIVNLEKQIRDAPDAKAPAVLDAKVKLGVLRSELKGDKGNLTVVGEVKSGVDKGKAVYVDETNDQQFVYDFKDGKQVRKPFVGDVDRMTSQVTASASSSTSPGVKAFREKLGGLDAKDVESARANRDNAIAALNTLNELTRLDQQGVTSGAFADGRIGAVNLLNTLGLVSNRDAGTLANSQTFNKVSGDLILATLGGKLGAGFSNEDRKFIAGLVPQLETSRKARQQLINFMAKKNQLIIDEAIRLEDYARENDGLKGFKPKIPIVNAPAPGSVQALSDSELKAAIEKAKKGK